MSAVPFLGCMFISKGETDLFAATSDQLYVPLWAEGIVYHDDAIVATEPMTTAATYTNTKHWRALLAKHTSAGTLTTVGEDIAVAQTASAAAELVASKWRPVGLGSLYSLDSLNFSKDGNQEQVKFACEKENRSSTTANPDQITANYFYMPGRRGTQELYGMINEKVYVRFVVFADNDPKVDDQCVEKKGFVRVLTTTEDYPTAGGNITGTATFAADGATFDSVTRDVVAADLLGMMA